MSQFLIQQSVLFHSILQEKLNINSCRLKQFKSFTNNTVHLFHQFSQSLILTSKNHIDNLKNDSQQNQNIIFLSKYIIDIIQELAIKFNRVIKKLKNEIIDPMSVFIQNQEVTNKFIMDKSQRGVYTLQNNYQYLKQLTKNFQDNLKHQSSSLQQKNQYQQIYHLQIQKCNQKWAQLKKTYLQQIMPQIDTYNSSRINFTIKQQIKTVKLLNQILIDQNVNDILKEYQQLTIHNQYQSQQYLKNQLNNHKKKFKNNQSLSLQIKDLMRQKIGRLTLFQQDSINNTTGSQYFKAKSYQSLDNISIQCQYNQNIINFNEKKNQQKKIVDNFVAIFTTKAHIKQLSQQKNFEYQHARNLILGRLQYLSYFLNKLKSTLHGEINLPFAKYRQLTALIKYIFAQIIQNQNQNQKQSIIYFLLYISYRIKFNNQQYLIKQLSKKIQIWKDYNIWFNLIKYLKKIKGNNQNNNQNNKIDQNQKQEQSILNKPLTYLKNGTKFMDRDFWLRRNPKRNVLISLKQKQKQKTQKIFIDAQDYQIMCQISYFMIRLQLQQKFVFNLIFQAKNKFKFSEQNIRKLIKTHYFSRLTSTNKIGSQQIKRKKRLQKKYNILNSKQQKLCWAIGKCLKYLKIDKKQQNITRLLLISKSFSQKLKKRIYQRYLIVQNNLSNSQRIAIYFQVCKPPYTQKVYYKMVKQMPQVTDHSQIIYLDAKRSLCWNQGLRINLMQILGVYAFYHPQVGYLQGMNYLCQNILKITNDNYKAYSIFQFFMNTHFQNMYTGKFDGLKIKIYQTMRVLQLLNPKLYSHLQNQKIQGQHFLLSWAITLWGQMSGQLSWVLWDGFIIKGWKWFIKTCIWLMKNLQGFLLNMNFQQIMKCLSELNTSIFTFNGNQFQLYQIDRQLIKTQINSIILEGQILKDIQKEYQTKINMINQYLKKIQNKNK